jgi:EAL domain-containing protein (putative c-di-GMP-specific phosphodiesterase class I)
VCEFKGESRVVRHIDGAHAQMHVGSVLPTHEGYCHGIASGDLPNFVHRTAARPFSDKDGSSERRGCHLGVALRLPDDRIYGTLCCYKDEPDASLDDRDLRLLETFGRLIAGQIAAGCREDENRGLATGRIREALDRGEPGFVYQPVFRLTDGLMLGMEALARFAGPPVRTPDRWFAEAGSVGLQIALELQAIRNAVAGSESALRQRTDLRLAVNASPETLMSSDFAALLPSLPLERIAMEITEHDRVENYRRLTDALVPLRRRGCKITVDDAGSGYASLRHILQIEPEVIKLDVSLTRDIDTSAGKRALAGGLIEFARQTGCVIIAEGVETVGELATLRDLRVNSAQGYLLARPSSSADLCRRIESGGQADVPIAIS